MNIVVVMLIGAEDLKGRNLNIIKELRLSALDI